ncbi:hypothetical protein D9758_009765 [Tetrapyrgos nigripes]|uniref:Uncharacterized protein n=1 Tax=Tetrapyrgos nigripes TaxID=182062 RepID=A0A8H5GKG8_9AGAR|nr:hypothetical protein D9758_009765 [Tetrapyrgos nigripes]
MWVLGTATGSCTTAFHIIRTTAIVIKQLLKGDPTPPPSNPPSHHSTDPDPNPGPDPHPNPPDSPSPSSHPDSDSDSDDNMSKATKAFDKVTKLEKDRSNWSTWVTRVQRAAGSVGYNKRTAAGIIGTLPDTIFRCYKNKLTSKELWDALKQDYDAKDPLTEASLEKQLFSLTCTNPAKVGKHLDNLIAIMDKLAERGCDSCSLTPEHQSAHSPIASSYQLGIHLTAPMLIVFSRLTLITGSFPIRYSRGHQTFREPQSLKLYSNSAGLLEH